MFSRRTDWDLTANPIARKVQELKQKGIELFDLTVSNPTACGFTYPASLLESFLIQENFRYEADAKGGLSARKQVREYYKHKGLSVDCEDLFLTASTSEAYSFAFRLLADPEDRVLFPCPSYPLFEFLANINDVAIDYYRLNYSDGGWGIDFQDLETKITDKTKAVVLVNPNNPTGSYVSGEELGRINGICKERNLALICDEVFHDFPLRPDEQGPSLAGNPDVLTFTLSGLSKILGLPQMKLSWIAVSGPESLTAQAKNRLEVICDTFLSVNTPVQNALSVWLKEGKSLREQIHHRVKENYSCVKEFAGHTKGVQLLGSQGGWYAVLRVAGMKDEQDYVLDLLEKHHCYVHPGFFYDFKEDGHIVLSLLAPEETFRQGLLFVGK